MEEKIITILKEMIDELENVNVSKDTKLISSGYIDSFDVITLLARLEEDFKVNLPVESLNFEDFDTVSRIGIVLSEASK